MKKLEASTLTQSVLMSLLCWFIAIAVPVAFVVGSQFSGAWSSTEIPTEDAFARGPASVGFFLHLATTLALSMSMIHMAKFFDGLAGSNWFADSHPRSLGGAGRWLFVYGLGLLLLPTVESLLASLSAAHGERALTVSIASNGLVAVIFGILLTSVGQICARASDVAAENARYV